MMAIRTCSYLAMMAIVIGIGTQHVGVADDPPPVIGSIAIQWANGGAPTPNGFNGVLPLRLIDRQTSTQQGLISASGIDDAGNAFVVRVVPLPSAGLFYIELIIDVPVDSIFNYEGLSDDLPTSYPWTNSDIILGSVGDGAVYNGWCSKITLTQRFD